MNENEAGKEFYIPPLPVFYTTFYLIPCLTLWTFLQYFNCFYNTMKMCKNVLSTFETLSFCLLSFLCFSRITSFLLQFSSESDERLPLCGHPFFSLLNVWLPHFMYTEYLSPQVQYPVMFCWVFLSCLVGESIIRDGAIPRASSKGCWGSTTL